MNLPEQTITNKATGKSEHFEINAYKKLCLIDVYKRQILSSAGHEKSCVNLPGPSGKAKYSRETDSEPVL